MIDLDTEGLLLKGYAEGSDRTVTIIDENQFASELYKQIKQLTEHGEVIDVTYSYNPFGLGHSPLAVRIVVELSSDRDKIVAFANNPADVPYESYIVLQDFDIVAVDLNRYFEEFCLAIKVGELPDRDVA